MSPATFGLSNPPSKGLIGKQKLTISPGSRFPPFLVSPATSTHPESYTSTPLSRPFDSNLSNRELHVTSNNSPTSETQTILFLWRLRRCISQPLSLFLLDGEFGRRSREERIGGTREIDESWRRRNSQNERTCVCSLPFFLHSSCVLTSKGSR